MIEWHTMSCRTISLLLVLLVIVLGQETATTSLAQQPRLQKQELGDCGARFASCSASDPQARRPICGSDNQTYPGRCHLLRAQCQGLRVSVKHRGRCKASPSSSPSPSTCLALVRRPLLFEPTCLEDGSFAPVQCHVETGYCWCVTPAGKPIPNSSVRNARPNCNRRGRRRSSARGRKQKKVGVVGCGREDRTAFNKNLLNIFDAEYSRQMAANNGEEMDERALLDWKFTEMDLDGDGFLVRAEYRDLRRLVKKMVKPKRCAKTFTRLCDLDHDQRVSRDEWAACLRLDFNLSFHFFLSLNSDESQEEDGEQKTEDAVLQGSVPSLPGISGSDESSEGNDEPEAIDCLSDRKAVLDEQKAGNSEFYVPECTPDGRYQKIQCYKSTGYCWCVHEDNGKPIPGTSIKDQAPKCDSVPAPSRPMHGCPEPRKQAFLRELLDFMTKKMLAAANNSDIDRSIPLKETWQSPEEHVATWNFMMLDKNKNKVLERKEWKNFRVLVSGKPQLCRCGKRLPRYCDVNHDRKISITEWLNCLDAQRANSLTVNPTSASRRKGLNPLEIYLKEDD